MYNDNDDINNDILAFPLLRTSYILTLNNQYGIGGMTQIYGTYDEGLYLDSDKTEMIVPNETTITVPTRNGYTFGGYYTQSNGKGTQLIDESGIITSTFTDTLYYSNATIYANWIAQTYKVTLNNSGGTGGTTEIYGLFNEGLFLDNNNTLLMTYEENSITVPTRTGYTFGGYYTETDGGGTKLINENGSINVNFTSTFYSSDVVLYAKWITNKVYIKYNVNGATGNKFGYKTDGTPQWSQTGQFGQWDRTGYNLLGWSATANATSSSWSIYSGVSDGWIDTNSPSIDIYAIWKIKTYTVTIKSNNTGYGSVSLASVTVPYNTTYSTSGATLTFSNDTKATATPTATTGYTVKFSKWSSTSGTITKAATITATCTKTANIYNVTYDYGSLDHTYINAQYTSTGYKPNWDKDFTIEMQFDYGTEGKRYLIIGNYDRSDAKALSIEITADKALRVYMGTGQVNKSSGTVCLWERVKVVFKWTAS